MDVDLDRADEATCLVAAVRGRSAGVVPLEVVMERALRVDGVCHHVIRAKHPELIPKPAQPLNNNLIHHAFTSRRPGKHPGRRYS